MSNFPTPADDAELARTATYPHLIVRIYATVYQRERINVSAGAWPIAQIGHQCSLVIHPEPFNPDGTLSTACQKFLINTVQHAVRQTGHRMCNVWGRAACTYVEAHSTILSTEPPSGGLKLPSDIQFDERHDPLGFKQAE